MRLQDKVAIVTGGGSGIGTAYTRRFLAEGAKVMIADIGEEQGTRTAAELAGDGDVAFVKTDIADPDSAQAAMDATLERFGTVDILVNNAAIYGDYVGSDHSLEYLKQVFDVNLHGQWVMAKVGRPAPGAATLGTHHQRGVDRRVPAPAERGRRSRRLRAQQLRVHAVEVGRARAHPAHGRPARRSSTSPSTASRPGSPNTAATEKQVPTDFQPMFATMSAMRRNTEPEHMVGPAVFFVSSDADLVNGQVLVVDGGNVMPV